MPKQILVTGGAGFVGSALALSFRAAFPEAGITALDNLKRRGSELNLGRLRAANVQFLHGDVRNREDLAAAPPPDLIVECSAEPSVLAGYGGSPEYLVNTNLTGCYNCLELARICGASFVFISTSRVYPYERLGQLSLVEEATRFSLSTEQPFPGCSVAGISESFPLDGPRSLYGMTKLAAELMVAEYGAAYRIPTVINRCGLISGPWQMGKTDQGVVVLWMAAHYFKKSLKYIGFGGTGKQVRDILAVSDLARLVIDQILHIDQYGGGTFNVGGGPAGSLSLLEMTALCQELTGNVIPITADPVDRPADIATYITDYTRVQAVRGWAPTQDCKAILSSVRNWLEENEQSLRPLLDI